jgi:hypothetical protein
MVFIVILVSSFGLISEIISKYCQCIIFGRDSMLIALLLIAFIGCIYIKYLNIGVYVLIDYLIKSYQFYFVLLVVFLIFSCNIIIEGIVKPLSNAIVINYYLLSHY